MHTDGSDNRVRGLVSTLASRALVVAAVAGITMLGNLRLQASEVRSVVPAVRTSSNLPVTRSFARASDRVAMSAASASDAINEGHGRTQDRDDVQLVPAIYAWNPDVRFVYFRHVSKWM